MKPQEPNNTNGGETNFFIRLLMMLWTFFMSMFLSSSSSSTSTNMRENPEEGLQKSQSISIVTSSEENVPRNLDVPSNEQKKEEQNVHHVNKEQKKKKTIYDREVIEPPQNNAPSAKPSALSTKLNLSSGGSESILDSPRKNPLQPILQKSNTMKTPRKHKKQTSKRFASSGNLDQLLKEIDKGNSIDIPDASSFSDLEDKTKKGEHMFSQDEEPSKEEISRKMQAKRQVLPGVGGCGLNLQDVLAARKNLRKVDD